VATLTAAGVSGREANVVQAAAGITPREVFTVARDYDDAEWHALVGGLARRGLLTTEGKLTPAGQRLKADIEQRTDTIALSAYEVLDDAEIEHLVETLTPLARAVVDTGDVPGITPIGISLDG
jgi:hypothetical protein